MDIKKEVLDMREKYDITFRLLRVPEHSDDHKYFLYEEALQQTKHNIDMDKKANNFRSTRPSVLKSTKHPKFFPAQKIDLSIMNTFIVGDIDKQIRLYKHVPDMDRRIQSLLQCTQKELMSIE